MGMRHFSRDSRPSFGALNGKLVTNANKPGQGADHTRVEEVRSLHSAVQCMSFLLAPDPRSVICHLPKLASDLLKWGNCQTIGFIYAVYLFSRNAIKASGKVKPFGGDVVRREDTGRG